jgi:hypothetical protein
MIQSDGEKISMVTNFESCHFDTIQFLVVVNWQTSQHRHTATFLLHTQYSSLISEIWINGAKIVERKSNFWQPFDGIRTGEGYKTLIFQLQIPWNSRRPSYCNVQVCTTPMECTAWRYRVLNMLSFGEALKFWVIQVVEKEYLTWEETERERTNWV